MKKITLKAKDTITNLQKEVRNTKDGTYQTKLRAIILIKQGFNYKEVCKNILISINTYYAWLHLYNEGGIEALKIYNKGGRVKGSSKYNSKIFIELFKQLDTMQEYWSIIKMQKFIYDTHTVDIPNETLRKIVKRAGYSYKSNRPSPYKGDKEKQEIFKKTPLQIWSKN